MSMPAVDAPVIEVRPLTVLFGAPLNWTPKSPPEIVVAVIDAPEAAFSTRAPIAAAGAVIWTAWTVSLVLAAPLMSIPAVVAPEIVVPTPTVLEAAPRNWTP